MLLRDKDRERIIRLAEAALEDPVEIWAYGSRVDGTAHDTSDLDLVLRGEGLKKIDFRQVNSFRALLSASTLPIIVEVLDWAVIPESFHKNILACYEVLTVTRGWGAGRE